MLLLIRFINQTLHNQIIEDNDWMIGEAINRFDAYVDDISTFGKVLSMDQQMQLLLRQTDTVLNTYPYFHDVQDLSEQLKRFTLMMENYVEDIYIVRDGNLPIVSGKNLLSHQDSVQESCIRNFWPAENGGPFPQKFKPSARKTTEMSRCSIICRTFMICKIPRKSSE